MPTRMDSVLLTVTVGGNDITASVLGVRLRFGLDLRIAEADIELGQWPVAVNVWDSVVISGGLQSTGFDTAGNQQRFAGYVYETSETNWTNVPKISCRGPLIIADKTENLEDEWAATYNPAYFGAIPPLTFEPMGVDLSNDGDGQTDAAMVTSLLTQIGLTGWIGGIGGTGRVLGTVANDQFVWRRATSALSFIEQLDSVCLGFRTFERHNNTGTTIQREVITPIVPFDDSRRTFNEGTDIFEGATMTRSAKDIKNWVECQGFDDGGGPTLAYANGGVSTLPPGVSIQFDTIQSNLVEKFNAADDGDGLAADEVAAWRLGESRYVMLEATFSTWRDDVIQPGDIIYVNAPHLLGVNQSLWLKHVEIEITNAPSWTQTLTVRGADYLQRAAAPVLGMTFPAGLGQT